MIGDSLKFSPASVHSMPGVRENDFVVSENGKIHGEVEAEQYLKPRPWMDPSPVYLVRVSRVAPMIRDVQMGDLVMVWQQ
ncbi:hypothetical protein [Streptomyces sp. CoH17]|uniref:hypothetical protein n=1 Tax=Streptomyces sp. CoH17 TaxID=2992806 RepID=UPI00226F7005|nr:hypothetical protein [Streptomyces sp. CoH17]